MVTPELFTENLYVYKMPEGYKGKTLKHGGITLFAPRKWTKEEIDWVLMLKGKGLSTDEIAICIDRDKVQVAIKIKRLGKKNKSYNLNHFRSKYKRNELFVQHINPKSILDLYAGEVSYYRKFKQIMVVSNDKNFTGNDYNIDALKCLKILYNQEVTFDIVDLDPFGSAVECFDLAIKMANKGIVITFGEMGHLRYRRTDFVEKHYGISTLTDFTIENILEKVLSIGKLNNKIICPLYTCNWSNISRVYFTIFPQQLL